MKASCKNCFYCNEHYTCFNLKSSTVDSEGTRYMNSCSENGLCSNWQAKNTDDMRCENCRYYNVVDTFYYGCDGEKIQTSENVCLKNIDILGGCSKFWPKS